KQFRHRSLKCRKLLGANVVGKLRSALTQSSETRPTIRTAKRCRLCCKTEDTRHNSFGNGTLAAPQSITANQCAEAVTWPIILLVAVRRRPPGQSCCGAGVRSLGSCVLRSAVVAAPACSTATGAGMR